MRGRKPKPTALKALEGNPGKRPLSNAEPKPSPTMPPRPKGLSAGARSAWDRLAPEMHRIGILSALDADQLEAYARLYAHVAECWKQAKRDGPVVMLSGKPVTNPYITTALQAETHLHKIRSEMGLSPVSRSRIKLDAPDEEQDELAAFLKIA